MVDGEYQRKMFSAPRFAVDEIREAMNHDLVVGTSRFKDEIEATTNRKVRMGLPGRLKNVEEREY